MAKFKEVVQVTFWSAVSFGFLCLAFHLVQLWHGTSALGWDRVPCTIEKFAITIDPQESESLKVELEYRYQAGGKEWTGSRWHPNGNRSATYEEISNHLHELTGELPTADLQLEGRTVFCRVDENDSSRSVLIPDRRGFIFACGLAGVALLFVVTPLVLARARGSSGGKLIGPLAFCQIFLLGGLGATAFFAWKLSDYLAMRKWEEAQATITERHAEQGSDIGSSRPRLHYSYRHQGSEYRASRFDVVEVYERARRRQPSAEKTHPETSGILATYYPGKQLTVFVDPAKPWHAVVDRSASDLGFLGLFAAAFVSFGTAGMWWTLRDGKSGSDKARKRKAKRDRKRS